MGFISRKAAALLVSGIAGWRMDAVMLHSPSLEIFDDRQAKGGE
jgi:hypothetical protein